MILSVLSKNYPPRFLLVLFVLMQPLWFCGCANLDSKSVNPKAAQINVRLGLSYLQQNRLEVAKIKLRRALVEDPASSSVQWANALLDEKLGQFDLAEEHYRKAIKINPRDSDAQNNFGAFLCRHGRVEEGLEAFEAAVGNRLYVHAEFAYTNAGICLLRDADDVGAEGYFRQALTVNSRYSPALFQMATLLNQQKRYLGARAYRQRLSDQFSSPTAKILALCVTTERAMANYSIADDCAAQLKSDFPNSAEAAEL